MQYYANDGIENTGSSMGLPADGYQQYQSEVTLQVQPKHDDYYSVQPGENYYSDYGGVDEQQTYSMSPNTVNSREYSTMNTVAVKQQNLQPQQEPNLIANTQPAINTSTPNYLQSDTDDSTGYQNIPSNKTAPNQDSDFDFST